MSDREYLVALYSFLPFGPARTKLLISYFGGSEKAWRAEEVKLLEIGLSKKIVENFVEYRKVFNYRDYFDRLKRLSIDYKTYEDDGYPENLKHLEDAPLVLYIKGNIRLSDVNAVAIVGSRKMTSYGRDVTTKLSTELASLGITIVSGLAFGVDYAAHKAAIEVGGRCIAVLAGGVDVITPRSNEWLGREILKSDGAIVSEYPPGFIPQKHFFPFRNRIISGLSKAVVVVEGMIKSGTIHTANHAASQGRQVFAVPGQITSPTSEAPHYLIKNGAKMVTGVNDILEELNMQLKVDKDVVEKVMPSDDYERELLKVLEKEELHLDEVARISRLNVSLVSGKLIVMELKGMVRNLGNGIYKRL